MKKVILLLVFLFSSSSLVNANTENKQLEDVSCLTYAYEFADIITEAAGFYTMEDWTRIFRDTFNDCVDQELYG
ncbi:hypothetical protein EV195_101320 [Tenacibaculum skagerrakense]|uniref:Uncharacterized protein n=1 Tax=Tenacibaculum skagerrakense TaxID=186571 RepID=A0A4R2P0M5_9FLAO|nr:hypothetical protein [Tenacibaculum skagerrakense]TCP28160.1 hypothetical protein EV195_101320 [Tenacibaculum skagerrakense]